MARRRSLNRRWSRRSLNGTGILNDDSNIYDEEDPLWWKQIEKNPNSIRPSGRFSLGEASSTAELNPNSIINDTATSTEWWEALQKTSQDLVPKRAKNNSNAIPKNDITGNTSDSDTDDRTREVKRRKLNYRKARKSSGKNAFSAILDSSEPAIESEPALSQNSCASRTSYQSLDELPSRRTRQQSKNASISSHNSNSSDTDGIRKNRPTLFKKPRVRSSRTAFDYILEADDSVIGPSQGRDMEKSIGESEAVGKKHTKSRSTILKPINDQTSLTDNTSLDQNKKIFTISSNQSAGDKSLEVDSRKENSRSLRKSLDNSNHEQNRISESDDESLTKVSQPRTHFRTMDRKKSTTNPFDEILSDSDKEDQKTSSKEKSERRIISPLPTSNKSSRSERSNSLTLRMSISNSESSAKVESKRGASQRVATSHVNASSERNLNSHQDESGGTEKQPQVQSNHDTRRNSSKQHSPLNSEPIFENVTESRETIKSHGSIPDYSSSKHPLRYESDALSTTSISEELKIGNPILPLTSGNEVIDPPEKMNESSVASISDKILQDWESDQSDASNSPNKTDVEITNVSLHSDATEINNDTRESRKNASVARTRSDGHIEEESSNDKSPNNHSNATRLSEAINSSVELGDRSNAQNEVFPTRRSTRRTLNYSSSSNSTVRNEIQSLRQRNRSGKIPMKESGVTGKDVVAQEPSEQRTRSRKFPPVKVNSHNDDKTVDSSRDNLTQNIETSGEKIVSNNSKKKTRSLEISEVESSTSDKRIFNRRTKSNQSTFEQHTGDVLEKNNNRGTELPEKSLKATRKSRASSRKTLDVSKRSPKNNPKVNEKATEPVDDSESDSEISRDPSAYELPDMNRSDSVTMSDSESEDELPGDDNTLGNHSSGDKTSSETNRSPEKRPSPVKTLSPFRNENDPSAISIDNTSVQLSELQPSTSGTGKKLPIRKSLVNPSSRRSNKSNVPTNQRSILNFLTSYSPRPIRHEPLPTQDEVQVFKEKLKAVTVGREEQKKLQKEMMKKELEEMRIKLANKSSNLRKVSKKVIPRKKPEVPKKDIDKAFIINGKVYKQPKLPRPKHWATDRLYKYLWKKLEPKCEMETRIRSEKFVIDLSNVVTIVMRRKKYENYRDEVDGLMMRMARLDIIKTRSDFYDFCYDFLPYEFRAKVTPILQPGNKITIPYDPATVNVPLINE